MGIRIFSPSSYGQGKLYGIWPSTSSATTLDLTFTRSSSNKTRTNIRGVIQDVPYNLVSYSEEFNNDVWSRSNSSISTNTTIAPNGSLTADTLIENTANNFHQLGLSPAITTLTNTTYTFTVYAKSFSGNRFIGISPVNAGAQGNNQIAVFDLVNGVFLGNAIVPSPSTPSGTTFTTDNTFIESVGNGWYRIGARVNVSGTNYSCTIRLLNGFSEGTSTGQSYTGDGTSGVYIWGAQLSQETAVQPYLKTTNRLNFPSIDYSLATGGTPSLVMEPTRTNLLLNSRTLSTQTVSLSAVQHTLSFYGTGTVTLSGTFTGTLSGTTASARSVLTFTPTAGNLTLTVNGSVTNAQLEAGAYVTSYIPTAAFTSTRTADAFSRNNLFTNGVVTSGGGTWFVDLDNNLAYTRDASDVGLFLADTSTGTTNSFCFNTPTGSSRMSIVSYVNSSATTLHNTTTSRVRAAIKWNGSTADVFVNGSKVVTGTTFTGTALEFMGLNTVDTPKYIKGMWLAPAPLSDADCLSATSAPAGEIITNGLVLYLDAGQTASYPGAGTTWIDLSGFGNNGILTNGASFDGANRGSIFFDGVNDYSNTSNKFMTNYTQFTFCGWVNIKNANGGCLTSYNIQTLHSGPQFYIFPSSLLLTHYNTIGSAFLEKQSNVSISLNVWYFVCATWKVGEILLYLNAVDTAGTYRQIGSAPTAVAGDVSGQQVSFKIGTALTQQGYINSNIAMVQVYNRVLSPAEILQNYNATKARFGL